MAKIHAHEPPDFLTYRGFTIVVGSGPTTIHRGGICNPVEATLPARAGDRYSQIEAARDWVDTALRDPAS